MSNVNAFFNAYFTTETDDSGLLGYASYPAFQTFFSLVRCGIYDEPDVYLSPHLSRLRLELAEFASWQIGRPIGITNKQQIPNFHFRFPAGSCLYKPTPLVICCGAGIDSTIAVWWARVQYRYSKADITVINIDYGAPYSHKEREAFRKLSPDLALVAGQVGVVDVWPRGNIDASRLPKGYIIPGRNALFASIGALFGTNVWIIANYRKIDDEPGAALDKNRRFYFSVSSLISQMFDSPRNVLSPVAHISKADSIEWFLKTVSSASALEILSKTTTCYHPTSRRCGVCYACAKLAMTLDKLGLLEHPLFRFDQPPQKQPSWKEYWARESAKGR